MLLDILDKTKNINFLVFKKNTPYQFIYEENNEFISMLDTISSYDTLYDFYLAHKKTLGFALRDRDVLMLLANTDINEEKFTYQAKNFLKQLEDDGEQTIFDITSLDPVNIQDTLRNLQRNWETLVNNSKDRFTSLVIAHDKIMEIGNEIEDDYVKNIRHDTQKISNIRDKELEFYEDNIIYIFNSMQCTQFFPIIRYKEHTKIYTNNDVFFEFTEMLKERSDIDDVNIYIGNMTSSTLSLIKIDVVKGLMIYSFPQTVKNGENGEVFFTKEFSKTYPNCIIETTVENMLAGSFEIMFPSFDLDKFYYLTLTSNLFSFFFFIKEFSVPYTLKKAKKFKYKKPGFIEKGSFTDYDATIEFFTVDKGTTKVKFVMKTNSSDDIIFMGNLLGILNKYYQQTSFPSVFSKTVKEEEHKTKRKKLINLKEKDPDMFADSSKVCMCKYQPIIIDEEDIEDWKNYLFENNIGVLEERQVFLFPPENSNYVPKYYYVCPDDKYPYPYPKERDKKYLVENFPAVPCCKESNFLTKAKNVDILENYDDYTKGLFGKNRGFTGHFKTTLKRLENGQLGELPDPLRKFFKKEANNEKFIRYGCSNNASDSAIHCVIRALTGYKYKTEMYEIIEEYYNAPKRRKEIVDDLKNNFMKYIDKDLLMQELYDNHNEIQENIDYYFDMSLFYRIIEELFKVNVFILSGTNDFYEIILPRYKSFFIKNYKETYPSIFLFKHYEPVNTYELIVCQTPQTSSEQANLIINDKFYTSLFYGDLVRKIHEKYLNEAHFIVIDKYKYINPYWVDWELILQNFNILNQFIDSEGKVYAFTISNTEDKLTLFVPPAQPLRLPRSDDKTVYAIEEEKIQDFFDDDYEYGRNGVWFYLKGVQNVFIPIKGLETEENAKECKHYETLIGQKDEKFYEDITETEKNANIILQLAIWIYKCTPPENREKFFAKNVQIVDKTYKKIKKIPYILKPQKTVEKCVEYLHEYCPEVFRDGKIHVDEETRTKIVKFSEHLRIALDGLPDVPNQTIVGILRTQADFTKYPFNRMFLTFVEYENYIREHHLGEGNKYLYHSETPYAYHFMGMDFLVQSTLKSTLGRALYLAQKWRNERINLGYYVDRSLDITKESYVIFERDMKLVENETKDTPPYIVYGHQKGGYSALLPI